MQRGEAIAYDSTRKVKFYHRHLQRLDDEHTTLDCAKARVQQKERGCIWAKASFLFITYSKIKVFCVTDASMVRFQRS